MAPVTAMTTFFPFVDCQKLIARFRPGLTAVVLINFFQSYRNGSARLPYGRKIFGPCRVDPPYAHRHRIDIWDVTDKQPHWRLRKIEFSVLKL